MCFKLQLKAICSGGCGQGSCVRPEKCDCPPGFDGRNCEICKFSLISSLLFLFFSRFEGRVLFLKIISEMFNSAFST